MRMLYRVGVALLAGRRVAGWFRVRTRVAATTALFDR
jgi:hypothetical protein